MKKQITLTEPNGWTEMFCLPNFLQCIIILYIWDCYTQWERELSRQYFTIKDTWWLFYDHRIQSTCKTGISSSFPLIFLLIFVTPWSSQDKIIGLWIRHLIAVSKYSSLNIFYIMPLYNTLKFIIPMKNQWYIIIEQSFDMLSSQ